MASTNDDSLRITSGSMAAAKKKDENFVPTGGMGQLVYRGDAGSNENKVGNIYMPAPYAVIVEPRNEGGNVTQGDKNYTATYNAYKAAASRLVDQTDEAANLKAAWSVPPKVSINNGNFELSGTSAFLKSNEAKQLRETLNGMKGKTYNTEDLNKQVEAWNSTFQRMSEQYLDTVDAMNQANSAIAESAGNAEYHKLTFSDMQKIGNSAAVGKSPEARTSSTKIFVGFDWDKNGKQIEKWVEAKEFFEEFNSMDDDKKRSAYRDLITRSNNGDVGAYSKLMYLNGGSQGKPANVDYDVVGDFFHTMGVNLLTGLAEAADFVTTYVPVFNTARLTGRIVSAASSGDINDFFKSDDIRNMIDDYEEAVAWENAYFSQLTPGSTQAAAIAGSVVGNVLGMAYSIWAGGVGNSAMNTIISRGINSANQALMSTGKFTSFERTVTGVGQAASGGDIMAAGSRAQFMIPTSIVNKFPNFSAALADKALSVMQLAGIGTSGTMPEVLSVGDRVGTLTTNTVGAPGNFANTATYTTNGLTVSTFKGGMTVSSTVVNTLSGKALLSERMFTNGIATAFRLAPLAGESALRHTDQYLQKVNAGEDVGDMSSYVMENTARDLVWGGALMGAGAVVRKLRGVSAATRVSPASAAEGAFDLGSQDRWYAPGEGHFTYDKGSNLLPSGIEKEKDLQDLVSTIVTANGESIFVSPNRTPVGTNVVAERSGADFINSRGFSSALDTQSAGTVPNTEYTGDFSSVEFAPIPNSAATDAGRAFGAVSSRTVTSYEVEPTNDGANLVKVTTNIDTNTTTTTKEKFSSIDEATDKARELSIPTTSPKTVANSDALKDATVAPLTINGVTPDVMPKGVSQVKVEPGIVYRTPDALVNDVVNLADREGWHVTNQDRLYRDYERYVQGAQTQQANFEHFDEAPAVPKEMYGTDIDGLIRLAAWAKANNYNLIPLRVQKSSVRKTFRMGNIILGTEYGIPSEYFPDEASALEWQKQGGERAIYKLDESSDVLERPPVTTDTLQKQPLLLTAGGDSSAHIQRFNDLMLTMPTLAESPVDYTNGIVDIVNVVRDIYSQVAMNINMDNLYENYGRAIAAGETPTATPSERAALQPLIQVLDTLGHYFDPSGKSLTQDFYLPTGLKPKKQVNIVDAILGKDGAVDEDNPVDGNLDDILLDPLRVGDSGFWQKRTGDLFRDADGNFTMDKSGTLEENLIAYTVSALTRGKNKLTVAANNEVARSKFDKNRSQITSKQALAMLKDADTVRTKSRGIQAKIAKDSEALAELKENYSGDVSTIDKTIQEKNYAKELNYTNSVNTMAQKGGYNQFLQMNPIQGSTLRFGANANGFRGIANIRRKLEKVNVTGTMWVERYGEKVNVGFGLEAGEANFKTYGHFRPEPAVNLGTLVNLHFDADRSAAAFLNQIHTNLQDWASGEGWDLMSAISEYARENFPLITDYEWATAQLMKKIGQNYHKYHNPEEAYVANVEEISKWIRKNTLSCFNSAIMMSNISNLDNRTIEALDEAAAYMLVGTPVKRSKAINYAQEAAVWSALGLNPRVAIGNLLNEPLRLIDVVGYRGFASAWKTALNPKEAARINNILSDLPSRFDNPEMVGLAEKAKGTFGKLKDKASNVALSPLEKSEQFKNILFWSAAEQNAAARFPGDKSRQLQETLRFFNDYAIAGGKGTVPGIATSSFGRTLNIFKTFTLRNFDDFIDFVEKVARGESGNNYWDKKYEKKHKDNSYKDKTGRNKFDPKIAARVIGGRIFRSYIFWLLVGSYFGKSFIDSLGGDPSGITEGGYDQGLYDDPDTDDYEGMTDFDNFVNSLPAGFILGALQDMYFAARRRGVEQGQFLGFDILNDPRFTKSLESKLPLGVAKNRFADMLDLVDRGYSFSSTGRKTYAAPETVLDVIKGFLFGKSTTQNSLAYGKYRYGMVDIWGDLSSGDWMDFVMNANPISGNAEFDTTRKDYTGVFNGSWNDISTMQLIIQRFKERQQTIINEFNQDKYRYGGEWDGLTDDEKVAKAKEIRSKKIDEYTEDVVRAVEAFTDAGNALSDKQITTMMYLFDFHEGEEDDEWNSSYARKRYVEAGLPDYDAAGIQRREQTNDGETTEETRNILDRSLVLQNAQQGFYGSSKEAANAMKDALKDFNSTYKEYNARVKALNEKYFAARKKNKKSAEAKQLSSEIEKAQNEYLDKLYDKLSPVIERYGTALVGTYDGADVLEDYMGNMIPYSSIKKYGQTFSSGNDIVYGQLTEWLQKRYGRNAPTAPSDKEVTNGITEIKKLLDQGKTATAKSKARAILEKIGRGSLGARRDDVETLRSYAYD